ncbi:putative chaperone-modulator protein CbpM (plasmid) [Legionella adelaidensis]|uniref:Putative chaperone-modulator protein CbpM n=1 Tax=Legionella adelaidensis TaxID=45056 RepID=A0A0W0R5P5_9GAMM|nr:chaperone modulator CbpM [Legionella adelaidensis]KTC66420.1 putative chaperone-modulator protein CbpM [Legionella adelaidensis]VEH85018.1 putative chaperone-modulator protein CbpM [Legionella adelaidensis]
MAKTIITGMLIEDETYSYVEVCEKYNLTDDMLIDMVEYGLFVPTKKNLKQEIFSSSTIARIQSALRLQEDLDINLPGVVLALELIDELERIKQELQLLRRQFEG